MTVQVSQIHPLEAGLSQGSSIQTNADDSFQKYLDDEQKRLAFMLSPFGQFDLGSWFSYPSFLSRAEACADVNLFSDAEPGAAERPSGANKPQPGQTAQTTTFSQPPQTASETYFANASQQTLQALLAKTGWLTPNLAASPLFYQAQLEGKLLGKLDLQSLVDQILTQVKMVKEKGKVELMVGLKPQDLGEILLKLTSRAGMVSIQIQAPEGSRKLLEAELRELEIALKKAGVDLEKIQILAIKEAGQNA